MDVFHVVYFSRQGESLTLLKLLLFDFVYPLGQIRVDLSIVDHFVWLKLYICY